MILGCVSKHCPFQFSPCTRAYLSKGLSGKPGMFTRISPSWQALNSVFFFWRGALLNTMRLLKSLLGLLASFYLASYNVALANALRRKAVKNVQLITSSLFTSFHMWPLVSWVLWLLIDAFKKLGFPPHLDLFICILFTFYSCLGRRLIGYLLLNLSWSWCKVIFNLFRHLHFYLVKSNWKV